MRDLSIVQKATTPIKPIKSRRVDMQGILSSGDAGYMLPVAYAPVLREDSVQSGNITLDVMSEEFRYMLLNNLHAVLHVHFIPTLAMERFSSVDNLNKAYFGVKERDADAAPVDYVKTMVMPAHGANPVFKTLGLHEEPGEEVNQDLLEAYNALWNFRAQMRSQSITLRTLTDTTLAGAFWNHEQLAHIVPDFDAARIDGEVELNIVDSQLPVRGLGFSQGASSSGETWAGGVDPGTGVQQYDKVHVADDFDTVDQIYAEMSAAGVKISLSNIEMARKTAAFARMRERYQNHSSDYIIDMLMTGLRIPDQAMKDPIHVGSSSTVLSPVKRNATDGANLDLYVAQYDGTLSVPVRLPPVNTGGILLATVEILPEQIWERQRDHWFSTTSGEGNSKFPRFLRDYLDPEKVAIVPNKHADVSHATPDGTFGYAPLNYQWQRRYVRVGGKFLRPTANAVSDTDRQRLWAQETIDPALSDDFYVCSGLHKKPFVDDSIDGFEIMGRMDLDIVGDTVFGDAITESVGDYDQVLAEVDTTRVKD